MTADERLLLHLVRASWDPSVWPPPADVLNGANWATVVEAALRHRVAGLVCRSLCELPALPAGAAPPGIVDAARVFSAEAHASGRKCLDDLVAILDVLAEAQIAALSFKGPALGQLAHASATIRPSRDLDILVSRAHMEPATAALARLGYRPETADLLPRLTAAYYDYNGQTSLFAEGRTSVDAHWAFIQHFAAVDLDMGAIWRRACPVDVDGHAVPSPGLEDTLLTVCLHGWKGKWCQLLWVADVAALLHRHPGLDLAGALADADAAGARRILLLGLALARDLFGTPLPHHAAAAIANDRACRRLLELSKGYLLGALDAGTPHHLSRYHLEGRERYLDRLRYVWRTVTTPRLMHYRMLALPDALFPAYVGVKLVHDYVALPVWRLARWARPRDRDEGRNTQA